MKRSMVVWVGCGVLLLAARVAQAQSGCTDSPENPTVVLALVGGAGALWSTVKARRRNRR